MSLQLFTRGVVSPEPGRGASKPVLEGGQAGSEDPPGSAVALSRRLLPSNNPSMVVPSLRPEALEAAVSLAAEPIPAWPWKGHIQPPSPPGHPYHI